MIKEAISPGRIGRGTRNGLAASAVFTAVFVGCGENNGSERPSASPLSYPSASLTMASSETAITTIPTNTPTEAPTPTFTPEPTSAEEPLKDGYAVEAKSRVSGYTLESQRKGDLMKVLTDWGVVDANFSGGRGLIGSTNNSPVRKVTAVFTDEEQQINQFVTNEGKVYYSSVTQATPGELTVLLHIGPTILDDPEKNKNLGENVDFLLLLTLYNLSHPEEVTRREVLKQGSKFMEYLEEKNKQDITFFTLTTEN